jgi:hypothetical protein
MATNIRKRNDPCSILYGAAPIRETYRSYLDRLMDGPQRYARFDPEAIQRRSA